METKIDNTKKDYTQKILERFEGNRTETMVAEIHAVNELVCFFNICFTEKNNFYMHDFNKKKLREVGLLYNQIKSNILSDWNFNDATSMFTSIDETKMKLLRFVIKSYVNNYEKLMELHNLPIDKNSMVVCLGIINRK